MICCKKEFLEFTGIRKIGLIMRKKYQEPQSIKELNKCLHCGSLFTSKFEDGRRVIETICGFCINERHNEPRAACFKCQQIKEKGVKGWN